MCTIIIVKCSWDGLLEGRNRFCVWSFWCSELCSADQKVIVKRGSVLDVRGPEWFWQPFCSLGISIVLGEWGELYQWFSTFSPDLFGMGMMVEHLKHEGTSHSSSDLLKIFVKMGASWSAQDVGQAGVTPSGPGAFFLYCFQYTWHTSSSLIWIAGVGERGVARGVNGCVERCPERVWGVFSNLQ